MSGQMSNALATARSWLFVPADRVVDRFDKAAASGADAIVVDLEDSVRADRKAAARAIAVEFLAARASGIPVVLRINGIRTAWWRDDAVAAAHLGLPVMLPKTASQDDASRVALILSADDARQGQPRVVALIESAAGVLAAQAIAQSEHVLALAFGPEDLALDLGNVASEMNPTVEHARLHVLLAAVAEGIPAIDGPSLVIDDVEVAGSAARLAHATGYSGKLAIHPNQVAVINTAFSPSDEEVAWARAIVAAATTMEQTGDGATQVDGTMVDEVVVARARRVLAVAAASA